MTTVQMAIRIEEDQLRGIDATIPGTHHNRSEVIRRAIDLYLYRLACERDAAIYDAIPPDDADYLADAEAVDQLSAWSTTPKW